MLPKYMNKKKNNNNNTVPEMHERNDMQQVNETICTKTGKGSPEIYVSSRRTFYIYFFSFFAQTFFSPTSETLSMAGRVGGTGD